MGDRNENTQRGRRNIRCNVARLYRNVSGYIKVADLIADSGIPYMLIHTADLTEFGDESYRLHCEGEKAQSRYVSRAAVAVLISRIILSDDGFGLNEIIGIND